MLAQFECMVDLGRVRVYRMTHIDNIEHILQYGITHKNSFNNNPQYIPIGDSSLIQKRNSKQVSVDNGDFNVSDGVKIILGDFIPFYFGVKMPMLFVLQNGGNLIKEPISAEDIVYLVCLLTNVLSTGMEVYFSDGHATDNYTSFYDKSRLSDFQNIVDWNAVEAPFWGGQDNLKIKWKKQAELLISNDLPPDHIVRFICYNQVAKEKLLKYGVNDEKIDVIPNAYF